jgi:hypothetical protein
VTYLSRLTALALAKEPAGQQGQYTVPTDSVPFTKAQFEDIIEPLKDESLRANDAVLQGIYQGPWRTEWDLEVWGYPDVSGHWLRAIIGPDTLTAGVSTTLAAAVTTVGATSISTAASIAAGTTIMIDTGVKIEYAITGTPSGSGPYTIPITTPASGLTLTHSSGVAVVGQSTHLFQQNRTFTTQWPSYSFTVWDGVDNARGFPGQVMQELAIKIDPKGIVSFNPKFLGWPSAIQTPFTPAYSTAQPQRGWGWTMANPGASTRGLSLDITLKRATEAINSSDGTQGPREVFPGALESDGTYKAIFENNIDYQLFYNYSQGITTATLTEPTGGQMNAGTVLAITMSKSGYTKFVPDLGQAYIQASFDLAGIYNSTDAGVVQATLKNFRSTAY